ncbi:MAG: META domain-containing protein [Terrimicrobiaceae bacterium]|nr:META domain-containing protein [Terrimicrobiaceae bacterium]
MSTWLCVFCLAAIVPAMAAPEPRLVGSKWTVTAIRAEPVKTEPPPTLDFEAGPAVAGSTGVNRFGGACTIEGDRLTFERFRTTRRAGSPEAMDIERAFLDALSASATFRIDPDGHLILLGPDGAPLLKAAPRTGD